ncbi:cytochrome o ubiquinol oxidase [Azorhizobium oxalatiphilum]|uniref:Cytochrome o ubiquinol oxidase n=1 Tax=Azorhizobium oxalatiphilum TaxID=980631 RepID=A0A917BVS2_9HYPH|nr:DedA family protein [Azorhizobium oxalatiphilum]GGF60596.1 cytochrome o ubiquinol oxidase [Azorhizobium oxalatiphilum]
MFDFNSIVSPVLAFVEQHQQWAAPIVFALAFGESLAVLSIFIPATVLLLGIGALIEASGLSFWPIWMAASLGAILGDTVSYIIGYYFKDGVKRMWPLSRHPEMVAQAESFFARYGVWGVAVGRFFGPARAVVPLLAGILAMRQIPFQIANIGSAFAWSFAMLAPGAAALKLLDHLPNSSEGWLRMLGL